MDDGDAQRLIGRLTEACRDDPRIVALLLFGSRAAGTADAYSDLDLCIVTADEAFDGILADMDSLARAGGVPLFVESFGNPAVRHVIYEGGAALELMVSRAAELRIEGPYQVLFDTVGAVEAAQSQANMEQRPIDEEAAREQVRRLVVWFWHDVEHLVTALGRGEVWWAWGQLDELRRQCLNLARLAAGAEPDPSEAYWKVDRTVSSAVFDDLRTTAVVVELDAVASAAYQILDVFRSLAKPQATANGVDYPERLDATVSAQLDAQARRGAGQS